MRLVNVGLAHHGERACPTAGDWQRMLTRFTDNSYRGSEASCVCSFLVKMQAGRGLPWWSSG